MGNRGDRSLEIPHVAEPEKIFFRSRFRIEDRDRNRLGVATGLRESVAQIGDVGLHLVAVHGADGQPAIGVVGDALATPVGSERAEENRRVRRLDRLGIRPNAFEVHKLAVIGGLLLGPQCLHRLDALADHAPPGGEGGAVICHFLRVPTRPDPKHETPVREAIEGRDRFGQDNGVVLTEQTHAGAEGEAFGHGGGRRETGEGIGDVGEVSRHFPAARVRRIAVGRNVGVLREPERLKAPLFGGPRQVVGPDHRLHVVAYETELHGQPPL